jgi:photosystem II stability/assembly factor-like uncharacterized protein
MDWMYLAGSGINALSFKSVAYGNNKYVMGGSGSSDAGGTRIYYSTNALAWTPTDSHPFRGFINGMVFTNGTFIAVGMSGKMARSTDGITWTEITGHPFGTSAIYDIVLANNRLVAVGAGGKIAYAAASNNPTSWTNVANTTFGTTAIRSIANNGNTWVAVGDDGKIAISTNNLSTFTTVNSGTRTRLNSIAFGNNRWVAVSEYGEIISSANGTSWSNSFTSDTYGYNTVYFANGRFITAGEGGSIMTSTNGTTWQESNDVSRYINSDDGSTQPMTGPTRGFSSANYHRFLWVNGRYIVTGSNGVVLLSY